MIHGPGRALRREVEHASDVRGTLIRLIAYLRPFWRHLLLVSLLVIVGTVLNVMAPTLIGQGVDLLWSFFNGEIEAEPVWSGLSRIMLLLLAAYIGSWATTLGSIYFMVTVGQNILY
jgi:ATP-binding cassette subfamily B multidrug efflux pump